MTAQRDKDIDDLAHEVRMLRTFVENMADCFESFDQEDIMSKLETLQELIEGPMTVTIERINGDA